MNRCSLHFLERFTASDVRDRAFSQGLLSLHDLLSMLMYVYIIPANRGCDFQGQSK